MSNREFPAPYQPDPRWGGHTGGGPAGRGDRLPASASCPAPDGYARASGTGGRGTGELDDYSRSPGRRRTSPDGRGQHAQGRARDSGERYSARGAADAPANGGSRRDAPGTGPARGSQWDERGGRSSRGRSGDPFSAERRDVRDDLRERLRRNGIGDWDGADRSRQRPGRNGTREDGWDDGVAGRRGRSGRHPAAAVDDWDSPDGPSHRRSRKKGADGGDRDGPGGRPPRRKGSWWRHWTWKKVLGVVAAIIGFFIICGAAGVAYAYSKTTIPNVQAGVFEQQSKVYFSDGKTLIGTYGKTNRIILNYNQIPAVLRNAVVAAEDKNFWHEGGISPTGTSNWRRVLRPHQLRRESPGRVYHHPAAGAELLQQHRHRPDRQPQGQGDLRRGEAVPGQVQRVDPPAVHEHDLPWPRRIRCRRRGECLLRFDSQRPSPRSPRHRRR